MVFGWSGLRVGTVRIRQIGFGGDDPIPCHDPWFWSTRVCPIQSDPVGLDWSGLIFFIINCLKKMNFGPDLVRFSPGLQVWVRVLLGFGPSWFGFGPVSPDWSELVRSGPVRYGLFAVRAKMAHGF